MDYSALQRNYQPTQVASPLPIQQQHPDLVQTLLNILPFGTIGQKLFTGHADQITPGEVGLETALTLLPFGVGKLAKGAVGLAKGARAVETTTPAIDLAGTPRFPLEDQRTLTDYVDYLQKRYRPPAPVINDLAVNARDIANRHGLDILSGSNNAIQTRVADYLDTYNTMRKAGAEPTLARRLQ